MTEPGTPGGPLPGSAAEGGALSERVRLLEAVLNLLSLGVVIATDDGAFVHENVAASAYLLVPHKWSTVDGAEQPPIRDAVLRSVIAEFATGRRVGFHTLTTADGGSGEPERLHLLALPLSDSPNSPTAVVLCNPDRRMEASVGILRQLYNLTSAEAKLAMAVSNGFNIDEAAEQLQITTNTARSHLKKVFLKTHTHRQGEMVRLVALTLSAFELPRSQA
jgi:DNA-binding CsgD family transcriptional regulator